MRKRKKNCFRTVIAISKQLRLVVIQNYEQRFLKSMLNSLEQMNVAGSQIPVNIPQNNKPDQGGGT